MTDTKKEAPEIQDGVRLEKGRVYLRDKRTGRVHQYEETLARMGFIESFVHGEKAPTVDMGAVTVEAAMTAQQRAAAWDAEARKNMKANEIKEVKADGDAKPGTSENGIDATANPVPPAAPVAPTPASAPVPPAPPSKT